MGKVFATVFVDKWVKFEIRSTKLETMLNDENPNVQNKTQHSI